MILKKIQEYSFLFVAFAFGWASLYGNALSFLLIVLLILNIRANPGFFWQNLKQEKYYIGIPVVFTVYMIFHTLVLRLWGDNGLKPSYGIFESMLLFFILIPLYVLSIKPWITVGLLKKALLLFCCGILFFNICVLFEQTGWNLLTHPGDTSGTVYLSRFGGNKMQIFGGLLMLEPQAMVLALASLIAFFLTMIQKKVWIGILAFLLLLFLSFTVTKAAMLAFVLGAIFGCVYIFTKLQCRQRIYTLITITLLLIISIVYVPQGFIQRFHEATAEIENVKEGKLVGGSFAPRIAMWKDAEKHFGEYALFGVGVHYKPILKKWYADSPDNIGDMPNVHNSFLEYWIRGGIPGFILILSLFLFPLFRMKRNQVWPLLALGGMTVIFVASNTCVLFVHTNSLAIILFWLSAFYFYLRDFIVLERES